MSTIALVTGASQGIGASIAIQLAAIEGMRLALVARNAANLQKVATACRELGAEVQVYPCDLTLEKEVQEMAAAVARELGTPDLLINNAGRFVRADLLTMNQSEFQSVMDLNLTSAFLVTRQFVEEMRSKPSATIFFMASVASKKAFPESGAYCVAKHALLGLSRSFRECTQGSGLRITTILPGATESPSWDPNEVASERLMPAQDVAKAVVDIYRLGARTVVEEITLRPLGGDL